MQWDISHISTWLPLYFWPALRILALFASAPIFSESAVNKQSKLLLALLCSFLIAPTLPPTTTSILSVAGFWLGLQQLLVGVGMGLTLQFIFATVRLAGEIIGLQMGLSFAVFFDPSGGPNTPIIASIMNVFLILLFLTFNGHLWMIRLLAESFQALPITTEPLNGNGFFAITRMASMIFSSGLTLGLPIITLLLTINLVLGLLNRLTPQFSIFVIGFPLTLSVGLVVIMLMMHMLSPFTEQLFIEVFKRLGEIMNDING